MAEKTSAEKREYIKILRDKWKVAKDSLTDEEKVKIEEIIKADAFFQTHQISAMSFWFVQTQMNAQGLEGYPYLDAKTFSGWQAEGYKVKKGEHSTLSGVTWITPENKETRESEDWCFPKSYHLFHRTQVEKI